MVKPEQVIDGLTAYAEAEILPALEGVQLWGASAALILIRQRADLILTEMLKDKTLVTLGLVDESGAVNVEAAVSALKETAKKHGKLEVSVPVFGKFKFGEADFDAMKEYIDGAKG